jgi:hypothetical protein
LKYSRANRRLRFNTLAMAAEAPTLILVANWPAWRHPLLILNPGWIARKKNGGAWKTSPLGCEPDGTTANLTPENAGDNHG